ncbi:V-type ATP synthase subunit F [Clostridia bacterium]|nr:V-type ATP synthase subunit F [Clostridia bacterium]
MKFFLISDNVDTQHGLRLAGIAGVIVHTEAELFAELDAAVADAETAIVLITEKAVGLNRRRVYDIKLKISKPLIVEIPDRHGTLKITDTIRKYVSEAVGVAL